MFIMRSAFTVGLLMAPAINADAHEQCRGGFNLPSIETIRTDISAKVYTVQGNLSAWNLPALGDAVCFCDPGDEIVTGGCFFSGANKVFLVNNAPTFDGGRWSWVCTGSTSAEDLDHARGNLRVRMVCRKP